MTAKRRPILVVLAVALITGHAFGAEQKIEGWGTVTDPDGDCKVKEEKGKLIVTVPGTNHNLHATRGMNAPRVLRDVEGDFNVTVRVNCELNPGTKSTTGFTAGNYAGLLLWDGENNYLRLERNARWQAPGMLLCFAPGFEYWKDGQMRAGSPSTTTADFFQGNSTWLQLIRNGDNVTAYYSHDGRKWTEAAKAAVEMPKKVQIGVAVISSADAPFTAEFEDFKVDVAK